MLSSFIILGSIIILLLLVILGFIIFSEHNYLAPTHGEAKIHAVEMDALKKGQWKNQKNSNKYDKRITSLKLLQTTSRPFNKYIRQRSNTESGRKQMLSNWEQWKRLYGPNGIFNPNNPYNPNNPNSWLNPHNPISPFHHR